MRAGIICGREIWDQGRTEGDERPAACWIIVGFWAKVTFPGYRFSILKNLRKIWTILSQNYCPVYGRVFVILQGSYGRKQRRTEGKNRGFRQIVLLMFHADWLIFESYLKYLEWLIIGFNIVAKVESRYNIVDVVFALYKHFIKQSPISPSS
jgi:hypothetical protein